jgi:hypothetical protein
VSSKNGTGTPQHLYSPNKKTHEPHPRVPTALPHLRNPSPRVLLRHTQTTTNTGPHRHQTKNPQDPPIRRHLREASKTRSHHSATMSPVWGGRERTHRPVGSRPHQPRTRFSVTITPSPQKLQPQTRKQTHHQTHTPPTTPTTPHHRLNTGTGSNLKRLLLAPRQPHRSA